VQFIDIVEPKVTLSGTGKIQQEMVPAMRSYCIDVTVSSFFVKEERKISFFLNRSFRDNRS